MRYVLEYQLQESCNSKLNDQIKPNIFVKKACQKVNALARLTPIVSVIKEERSFHRISI